MENGKFQGLAENKLNLVEKYGNGNLVYMEHFKARGVFP